MKLVTFVNRSASRAWGVVTPQLTRRAVMRHQVGAAVRRRTLISGLPSCSFLVAVLSLLLASQSVAQTTSGETRGETEASGLFAPAGPPLEQPVRVDAGGSCVVDLRQAYVISGPLSGSLDIDYRILVHGPCEVPPVIGKYDEEWIAHGTFTALRLLHQAA